MLYLHILTDASVPQHELELTIAFVQDCVQASHKQVQHQRDVFRQEAETAQKQVQDYVQQKHQKEAELYIKVSTASHFLLTVCQLFQLMVLGAAVCSCSQ